VLLERDREVSALKALIGGAATGRPSVAVIEGPPGIGKSALVAEARRLAAGAGFTVCSARGGELEREFGFGAVRQLFERPPTADPGRLLRGAAAAARPVLGWGEEPAAAEVAGDPSFASLHGLYWVAVHLCEDAPLLVAVDDLHWCDAPSLRFLAYLGPRLEGLPVLVVLGLRSELGAGSVLLRAVAGDPAAVPLRPAPLSEEAATVLVTARLGGPADAEFARACHQATGGNPLLLGELLKGLAADGVTPDAAHVPLVGDLGPRSVSRAVFLRLARLPADAVAVAEAVAVLGDGADLAVAAALAGLSEDRATRAVAALARAEILRAAPPLGFVHPLVAAAVYQDVPPGERQLRHRQTARLLSTAGAPAGQVAGHLLNAPATGEAWVVRALQTAADQASRAGAAESAIGYLSRALAEPPEAGQRSDLLLALGRAETLTSGPAAAAHLSLARELLTDPAERAAAAQLLARALLFTGSPADAAEVAHRAAAEAAGAGLDDLGRRLEAFEMFCALFGAGGPTALARIRRHRTQFPGPGTGVGAKMLAAIAAQEWVYAGGPADACSALSLAALEGGELIAADNGLLATCAITNLVLADRAEAERWWQVARADAHRRGSLFAVASLNLWHGFTLLRRGELVDAWESLVTARGELDQWGSAAGQAHIYCDAFLAMVAAERSDLAAAWHALKRSSDLGGSDEGTRYWVNARATLLLAEGRYQQAAEAASDYARRFDHLYRNPVDAPWRSHKAVALGHLGRRDEAIELAEAELELARAWGAPGTMARSLRTLGAVEHGHGLSHLEEAVAVTAGTPARLEHAKALAAYGAALRHARRSADARGPLREALGLATACGAEPLATQARSELYAAGARPRTTAVTGPQSLTASERRVAALAAEGRSNREVAEALFVTPKTVEMHLGNIYRKLGISARRELPAALGGQAHGGRQASLADAAADASP
jgi:DNA-binding CsgD family transcriptional regulator